MIHFQNQTLNTFSEITFKLSEGQKIKLSIISDFYVNQKFSVTVINWQNGIYMAACRLKILLITNVSFEKSVKYQYMFVTMSALILRIKYQNYSLIHLFFLGHIYYIVFISREKKKTQKTVFRVLPQTAILLHTKYKCGYSLLNNHF